MREMLTMQFACLSNTGTTTPMCLDPVKGLLDLSSSACGEGQDQSIDRIHISEVRTYVTCPYIVNTILQAEILNSGRNSQIMVIDYSP